MATETTRTVNSQMAIAYAATAANYTDKKKLKSKTEIVAKPRKKRLVIADFTDEMNNFASALYEELSQDSQNADITQDDIANFTRRNFTEKMRLLFKEEETA